MVTLIKISTIKKLFKMHNLSGCTGHVFFFFSIYRNASIVYNFGQVSFLQFSPLGGRNITELEFAVISQDRRYRPEHVFLGRTLLVLRPKKRVTCRLLHRSDHIISSGRKWRHVSISKKVMPRFSYGETCIVYHSSRDHVTHSSSKSRLFLSFSFFFFLKHFIFLQ